MSICTVFERYFDFHVNKFWNLVINEVFSDEDRDYLDEEPSRKEDIKLFPEYYKKYSNVTLDYNGETHTNVQMDPYRKFLYSIHDGKITWVYPTFNDIVNNIDTDEPDENIRNMYKDKKRLDYLRDVVLPKMKILYYLTCDTDQLVDMVYLYANDNTIKEGDVPIEIFKKSYDFLNMIHTISMSELSTFIQFIMPYSECIFKMDKLQMIKRAVPNLQYLKDLEVKNPTDDGVRETLEEIISEMAEEQSNLETELDIIGMDGDIMIT